MKEKILKVKPIPVPMGYVHPPPPNDILPRHEFTMGLIGKFYCRSLLFSCCSLYVAQRRFMI